MLTTHLIALTLGLTVLTLPAAPADPLPVTQVVLFRSGVGYVERSGTVEDDTSLTLNFKTDQINDLLKSLVLQDLDGGRVLPVTYTPRDPITRTLQSFAIDLSDNPTLRELLNRLRGVEIEVRLATQNRTGRIVGVEERSVHDPKGNTLTTQHQLHLATVDGLETLALEQVQGFALRDERLQEELEQALTALAGGLDNSRKQVKLAFQGEGERRVRVGYVVEMPVWKMAYRLMLSEEEKPFLQGWAIVENTSEEDWSNVRLSLVSGRPVSFIQDLYQPLYMPRPEVRPRLYASLRPRTYAGATGPPGAAGAQGPVGPPGPQGDSRDRARRLDRLQELMEQQMTDLEDLGWLPGEGSGVISMASAEDLGALFEYRIDQPVSLPRQRSALIPIVNQEMDGEPVSVYNPATHPRFALYGLRLKNTSDLALMGGPMTVYTRGAYGGDALIEDIEPGGERLLTYALDLKMEVAPEQKSSEQDVVALKIVHGTLIVTRKLRSVREYAARNRDQVDRILLVEHPRRDGWELVQPEKAHERTAQLDRFRMEVGADEATTLTVTEEHRQDQKIVLNQAAHEQVQVYLRNPLASDAVKAALNEVMEREQEIGRRQAEVETRQERIEEIDEDQARIRDNMERLDRNSELYQRYVGILGEQETELDRLRTEIGGLEEQVGTLAQALEDYLEELTVE